MNSNGRLFLCKRNRLEQWGNCFEERFAGHPILPLPADDTGDGVLASTNEENDLTQTLSLAEVEKAVFALMSRCACGVDDIPAEFRHAPHAY